MIELDLRFDALTRPRHLQALHKRLLRHPALKSVIDHGSKPRIRDPLGFDGWAVEIGRLARDTAALVKLSGLTTQAVHDWTALHLKPYVDHLLATFGPQRMMFGSDWPVCLLAGSYGRWFETALALTAECSEDERAAIFGGNAVRFYDLDV